MKELNTVQIHSDDIPYMVLKKAVMKNSGDINLELGDKNTTRGFQDVEWIMFTLMAIPVAESIFNIIVAIKNELKKRIEEQLRDQEIYIKATVITKITLPFFQREIVEEKIIIDTSAKK
jgi:hypothetical protein